MIDSVQLQASIHLNKPGSLDREREKDREMEGPICSNLSSKQPDIDIR